MSHLSQTVTELIERAQAKHLTIGTCESCTGGFLAQTITNVPGASEVFVGSVVSYACAVKHSLLGVSEKTLKDFGAVSEECAYEMAQGGLKSLGCDLCVSITGIAGPGGATKSKPVGTVCFGIANSKEAQTYTCHFNGDRQRVRLQSVEFALQCLLDYLK